MVKLFGSQAHVKKAEEVRDQTALVLAEHIAKEYGDRLDEQEAKAIEAARNMILHEKSAAYIVLNHTSRSAVINEFEMLLYMLMTI